MSNQLPAYPRWPRGHSNGWTERSIATAPRGLRPAGHRAVATPEPFDPSAGIAPRNLSMNGEGTLRIALDTDWREMLGTLPGLGTLLVITRNEAAVLARYRVYPKLCFDPLLINGEDEEGEFHLDFNWWSHAYAKHSLMPRGKGYAIEFLDAQQQAFHSVVLTPDSSLPAFGKWLRRHQLRAPHSAPSRCRGGCAGAASQEDESGETPAEAYPLDRSMLLPFLQRLSAEELPMRVAVGHEAIVQQHSFRPRNVRESGSWIFASDDETGLHFDLHGVDRVEMHGFPLHGRACRSIKAYHANGRLLFFLAPSGPAYLDAWNGFFAPYL